MLKFKWIQGHQPIYKTKLSVGADLRATRKVEILPLGQAKIPLGVFIEDSNEIYDIQIRARSSLFKRFGCLLANGVGTVDADYPEEICAVIYNPHQYNLVTVPSQIDIVQMVIHDQKGLVSNGAACNIRVLPGSVPATVDLPLSLFPAMIAKTLKFFSRAD